MSQQSTQQTEIGDDQSGAAPSDPQIQTGASSSPPLDLVSTLNAARILMAIYKSLAGASQGAVQQQSVVFGEPIPLHAPQARRSHQIRAAIRNWEEELAT